MAGIFERNLGHHQDLANGKRGADQIWSCSARLVIAARWVFHGDVRYRGKVMKRALIGFLLGGTVGVLAGAGGMLLAYPFLFPPAEVNETVAEIAGRDVAAFLETRFREGVSGQDAAHWGRGGVHIYQGAGGNVLIELQPDFEVGPGPNFWVYLNSRGGVDNEAEFEADNSRLRIAKLKSFTGSQVYAADAEKFAGAGALTIWCESFGQYIASADL